MSAFLLTDTKNDVLKTKNKITLFTDLLKYYSTRSLK